MARNPSLKVGRPWGMIMNSWKSIGASEWAPPLMTLAIGTGSTLAFGPPKYLKSGWPRQDAAALAVASETARMALAPSRAFVSVPSSLSIAASTASWSRASIPRNARARVVFTLATALLTPLPRYRFLLPSRSSTASCSPVLAPEGTAARPIVPQHKMTSTSTVGLPRESRISRA
ncbi:MAG: hypothetical protein BWX84_01870 [Verrucomicrobia bacterium ADurb.Bin118]|nr:MAG: hypothetical protein BWX84_01870 [Verrucomicrobia bacterium ADurb.Bin118]